MSIGLLSKTVTKLIRSAKAAWGQRSSGILSGRAIAEAIDEGSIIIDPYDRKHLNPASYDLTLGDEVKIYDINSIDNCTLDSKKVNPTRELKIPPEGIRLLPGTGYLMHTRERVGTTKFVPIIDGKSSIGRLFSLIHYTAGYGDPGFAGQYTLEVSVVHPIILYASMRICQIRFQTISGEVDLYNGHYKGETAQGAVASHAYEQF
jgi:dCTP deaminase